MFIKTDIGIVQSKDVSAIRVEGLSTDGLKKIVAVMCKEGVKWTEDLVLNLGREEIEDELLDILNQLQ